MRDQNLSCLVEQLLRDRAGRLAGRRFANGATGPIAGRGARELPEEIRSLGCVWDGEGQTRVELCFIAGCAGNFAYEKACDRPDMLSQPLLRARQKARSPMRSRLGLDSRGRPRGRRRDCCGRAGGRTYDELETGERIVVVRSCIDELQTR